MIVIKNVELKFKDERAFDIFIEQLGRNEAIDYKFAWEDVQIVRE